MDNEKEQIVQRKIFKNIQFEEKRHIKKYNGVKFIFQGVKNPKVIFDAKWNKKFGKFQGKTPPS